jgi:tetratricopeptide (TPR) repeat protein
MKDALERTPAYELILIYVDEGVLQLEKKNFREAYQYAEKAISYRSNLVSALIVRGKALKALGKGAEALLSFMEALEITESAEAHYEIGTIYEKEGKVEKAREHFQKALELNPKLEKAKERLNSLGVKK